jgi:hypothetical protein
VLLALQHAMAATTRSARRRGLAVIARVRSQRRITTRDDGRRH